jgi:hypothetical protein
MASTFCIDIHVSKKIVIGDNKNLTYSFIPRFYWRGEGKADGSGCEAENITSRRLAK